MPRRVPILLLVFCLHALIVSRIFVPQFTDVGVWDESVYVNLGREWLDGTWPPFALNPAAAGLYALTYLPFQSSADWLLNSCGLARFILFALVYAGSALVAWQLRAVASPLIVMGLVAISPLLDGAMGRPIGILNNGSTALFAAMTAFALWQLLAFAHTRSVTHLWGMSAFLGLAALSRNEGTIVWIIAMGLVLALRPRRWVHVLALLVPFGLLVGGYVLSYGLVSGTYTLGTAQRSYIAFEQGHGMSLRDTIGANPWVDGQYQARALFGTPEENHYSVLRAIRRNPTAYAQRIPRLTKQVVRDSLEIYGWHFALFCFALALRGLIALIQQRHWWYLAVLVLWPGYSVLYVLLQYQATHLLLPFLSVFLLATVGAQAVIDHREDTRERLAWIASLVTLTILGALAYQQANDLLLAPILLLLGLSLIWHRDTARTPLVASLVILALALIIRFATPHKEVIPRDSTADGQAVRYLQHHFPPETRIAAWAPGKVWSARMTHVPMHIGLRDLTSIDAVERWMDREHVRAIYVDKDMQKFEPALARLLHSGGFQIAFTGTDPDNTVLILVRD